MIFILLIYAYDNSSSQTCSLKYQFRALENVTCGMSGPTVLVACHFGDVLKLGDLNFTTLNE